MDARNILRTNRTYAAKTGAESLLEKAIKGLSDLETNRLDIDFVIAVNEAGRFAPVVFQRPGQILSGLVHKGITVVG